ncbi:MAG TPA: SDR family oxidoreductase, partial [Pedobacter sp.]|nr:SDR family oxidoreductase [Pedobacter sp.]
ITGNMGYIGPHVVKQLRDTYPDATLMGFDMAYFAASLTNAVTIPELDLDAQLFGDVRKIDAAVFQGVDVVIHLSAISNDAMGTRFEEVTMDVNYRAGIRIAKLAKASGARAFVFASSCSMYGSADGEPKTENDELNPLTAYAKSKVATEQGLAPLADENFTVTCLRFATACGMSPRLRLDLVLNDFVAGAVTSGKIEILSDGSPWRPLIHVKDMARAIDWAVSRTSENGGQFLAVNTGSKAWNFQVREIAETVASVIPGTQVIVNEAALPDKRSYKVNFDLFAKLAPLHQPLYSLERAVEELMAGLLAMKFDNSDFRQSLFMRLKLLVSLQEDQHLSTKLEWRNNLQTTL